MPPSPKSPSIGLALWLIDGPTMTARVEWAIEHGFSGLGLHHCFADAAPADKASAAALAAAAGLSITYHPNLMTSQGPDWELLERVLADVREWQQRTGAVLCCCFDALQSAPDAHGNRVLWEDNLRMVKTAAQALAGSGVAVGLENNFRPGAYHRPADLERFARLCAPTPVVHLLDVGHAHLVACGGEAEVPASVADFVRAMPATPIEVHFSDNPGDRDRHLALGQGTIDLPATLAALFARNFVGQLTIEVCVDIVNGLYAADPDNPVHTEAILRSRDRIRQLVDRQAAG